MPAGWSGRQGGSFSRLQRDNSRQCTCIFATRAALPLPLHSQRRKRRELQTPACRLCHGRAALLQSLQCANGKWLTSVFHSACWLRVRLASHAVVHAVVHAAAHAVVHCTAAPAAGVHVWARYGASCRARAATALPPTCARRVHGGDVTLHHAHASDAPEHDAVAQREGPRGILQLVVGVVGGRGKGEAYGEGSVGG